MKLLLIRFFMNKYKGKILSIVNKLIATMNLWSNKTDLLPSPYEITEIRETNNIIYSSTYSIDPINIKPYLIEGKYRINIGWLYLFSIGLLFLGFLGALMISSFFLVLLALAFGFLLLATRQMPVSGVLVSVNGILHIIPRKRV